MPQSVRLRRSGGDREIDDGGFMVVVAPSGTARPTMGSVVRLTVVNGGAQ